MYGIPDIGPELLHQVDFALPPPLSQLLESNPPNRLAEVTHILLAVDNGKINQRSSMSHRFCYPLHGFLLWNEFHRHFTTLLWQSHPIMKYAFLWHASQYITMIELFD